jgi:putative oxidoreductase
MNTLNSFYSRYSHTLSKAKWLGPLLARLVIGIVFALSGFKKLGDISGTAAYFDHLGIPFAQFQAPFVAVVESLGSIAVLLGLGVRLVSPVFIIIMIVALSTAKSQVLQTMMSFLGSINFLFIVLLVWLSVDGAGRISLDHFLKSKKGK